MTRPTLLVAALTALAPAAATAEPAAADAQAQALDQAARNTRHGPSNPHPGAQWFPEAGLGLFIHWGIASVTASGDLSWAMLANKPWKDATVTPNNYYAAIRDWKPDQVDYDATLAAAKAAGFTYAVMVTKHHDGFTLWPSDHGDLGTKQTFGGRDFVAEFVAACRKHGLKVGLYYSPPDWWFDRHVRSFAFKGPALDMDHRPVALPKKPADHDARRAALIRGQVTELLTRYGTIDLLWFDGGRGEIPNADVRKLQPAIVLNKRNRGPGDYGDSEGKLPAKRFAGWFETCETLWPSRKWSYTAEDGWDTAAQALTKLAKLRAWGGNLLGNVGPKGDGSIPPQALAAWTDMAAWMSHSRESVIGAGPGPWPADANLPVTTRPGTAYAHFLPAFPGSSDPDLSPLADASGGFVWKNAPRPASATLLRTGQPVPFEFADGTLRIARPADLRADEVEVVKLTLSR